MDTVTLSFDLLLVVPSAAYLLGVALAFWAVPKGGEDTEPLSELAFGALMICAIAAAGLLLAGLGHGFYLGVT